MNMITRLRIAPRLMIAFASIVLLAVALAAYGLVQLAALKTSIEQIEAERLPKVQLAVEMSDQVDAVARNLRNTLIYDDNKDEMRRATDGIATARARVKALLDELDKRSVEPEERQRVGEVLKLRPRFVETGDQFMALVRDQKRNEAKTYLASEQRDAQDRYLEKVDALKAFQLAAVKRASEEGRASYERARAWLIGLLIGMLVLSAVIARAIASSVAGPLRRACDAATRIADGDLTQPISASGRDETADLLHAMKAMQESLSKVVGTVRSGVDNVSTASAQIAVGNQDLSGRTEEQASSLQQTAASMEQLTSTVKTSADNARQADQLAKAAAQSATRGGEVVDNVVATMQAISHASGRIADIINVIDGIAFQTNILALNAAVEAARAGEQGRGFAVVASEVRSLAQRSAQAAREIKNVISESVGKVEAGSAQVAAAGSAMNEIVQQVKRVTDLIGEISSASQEQSSGIGQVNAAITQMDQVTQQNAALVEESAAAAASLKEQAARLAETVAVFKVDARAANQVIARVQVAAPSPQQPAQAHKPTSKERAAKALAAAPAAPATAGAATSDWEEF